MRIKDIEQTQKYPRVWDAQVGAVGTTKIAAAFVSLNASTMYTGDEQPQNLRVYLGKMPVIDWHDIEVCDVGFNPETGKQEWVVNIQCAAIIPIEMDYFDTIPTICEMLKNCIPILDVNDAMEAVALDADIICKSVFIADFLDVSSRFYSRPDAE